MFRSKREVKKVLGALNVYRKFNLIMISGKTHNKRSYDKILNDICLNVTHSSHPTIRVSGNFHEVNKDIIEISYLKGDLNKLRGKRFENIVIELDCPSLLYAHVKFIDKLLQTVLPTISGKCVLVAKIDRPRTMSDLNKRGIIIHESMTDKFNRNIIELESDIEYDIVLNRKEKRIYKKMCAPDSILGKVYDHSVSNNMVVVFNENISYEYKIAFLNALKVYCGKKKAILDLNTILDLFEYRYDYESIRCVDERIVDISSLIKLHKVKKFKKICDENSTNIHVFLIDIPGEIFVNEMVDHYDMHLCEQYRFGPVLIFSNLMVEK